MIIFIDFDGVLHTDRAYLHKGRPVLHGEGKFFMWAPHLAQALAPYPDVKIVLSTSWARALGFTRARRYLGEPLKHRVIGATWHSDMANNSCDLYYQGGASTWWDTATRYQQICRYVERARLDDWIAIDDDDEGWAASARHRLVHTDPDKGISDPEALALLRKRLEGN